MLETIKKDDWFAFKNYRVPPPMAKKILDGVSIMMLRPTEWKDEQNLLSDSVVCARNKEEIGLRSEFDCNFVFQMKDYDVFKYVDYFHRGPELDRVLSDSRLTPTSYYVVTLGPAAPLLMKWLRANRNYVNMASLLADDKIEVEKTKKNAARIRAEYLSKVKEIEELETKVNKFKLRKQKYIFELEDLELGVSRATEMKAFITESLEEQKTRESRMNYYELMERKIEQRELMFKMEMVVELMKEEIEAKVAAENSISERAAIAKGLPWEPPQYHSPNLKQMIIDHVTYQQELCIYHGENLGYGIEAEENVITDEKKKEVIHGIVQLLCDVLNEGYNDDAVSRSWIMFNGREVKVRSLYILVWKAWKEIGVEREELKACAAWEDIFGDMEECARRGVIARVSDRMSKVAKEQGRIWVKRHKTVVMQIEQTMAKEFSEKYPNEEGLADGIPAGRQAIEMLANLDKYPPEEKALMVCWIRIFPEQLGAAKDERAARMATEFEDKFRKDAPLKGMTLCLI